MSERHVYNQVWADWREIIKQNIVSTHQPIFIQFWRGTRWLGKTERYGHEKSALAITPISLTTIIKVTGLPFMRIASHTIPAHTRESL